MGIEGEKWQSNEMGGESCSSSFATMGAYMRAVASTIERVGKRAGAREGIEEEEVQEAWKARCIHNDAEGGILKRELGWPEAMALGIGGMVGAGILVATGKAAYVSGPSVIVSYFISGMAALLSSLCYTEFAAELPSAGGAFTYLRITFGEFAAYFTGANLIMEYVISNAAVARSFTSYFATVFGVDQPDAWRLKAHGIPPGYDMLDLPAVAIVLLLTICICCSTKKSSCLNIVVTMLHLSLIGFIVIAGFAKGSLSNLTNPANPQSPRGFFPHGAQGVFNGAAIVYFSYIGYDAVSTMAEEVRKPAKTLPIAISGSVLIVTVLYCLMAAAIVVLVPYDQIDLTAPFSLAFRQVAGWNWAPNIVGLGACVGILSSLLVALLGQARYVCVIGRTNMIPPWFAAINSSTGTPLNASLFLGFCTAIIALFTELDILVDLISIGTLFVFYMVANALIFRRHVLLGVTNPWPTLAFLVAITALSVAFISLWQHGGDQSSWLVFCGAAILLSTIAFKLFVPTVERSKEWEAPLMPFLAVISIFLNVFLVGSVKVQAFERFGIWSAVTVVFYLGYSVHAAHDAEAMHSSKICCSSSSQLQPQIDKVEAVSSNCAVNLAPTTTDFV